MINECLNTDRQGPQQPHSGAWEVWRCQWNPLPPEKGRSTVHHQELCTNGAHILISVLITTKDEKTTHMHASLHVCMYAAQTLYAYTNLYTIAQNQVHMRMHIHFFFLLFLFLVCQHTAANRHKIKHWFTHTHTHTHTHTATTTHTLPQLHIHIHLHNTHSTDTKGQTHLNTIIHSSITWLTSASCILVFRDASFSDKLRDIALAWGVLPCNNKQQLIRSTFQNETPKAHSTMENRFCLSRPPQKSSQSNLKKVVYELGSLDNWFVTPSQPWPLSQGHLVYHVSLTLYTL